MMTNAKVALGRLGKLIEQNPDPNSNINLRANVALV